jgi:M3 family oligoendopeptidase
MTFKHVPDRPQSLTAEYVTAQYKALTDRIAAAEASESSDGWQALFGDWNALKSYVGSEGSRIHYAQSKDMADPTWEAADKYFREAVQPASDDGNSALVNALLASRHKVAIANRYGAHLIRTLETAVEPLAPINSELRVKESDLVNQYDKLVASGEVTVDGKTVTLAVARSLQSSEVGAIRHEAFTKYRQWFLDHRTEIAGLFDQLVKLRDQMGRNLGHTGYVPLGYLGMGRTDYGPAQAAEFRAAIRQYAVPLQTKLFEHQAGVYGMPTLKPWDVEYDPELSLPSGIVPADTQLDKAQKVFDALSPQLGAHFTRMRKEGLIDLENRKGKRAGAFCTSFSDEGLVAIFCNSTGDPDDVATLTHEMGHAFQGWESQGIDAVDLQWPTSDAAEIHSMGMEYLSMRHMDEFFSPADAEKFRRERWKRSVELLCWVAIVDEFQHWAYEHAQSTIDERDAAWSRIWGIYKPGIDYTGIEGFIPARLYCQGHPFWAPFYYIDYAIADTGAMQLALIDADNHERAMDAYLTLCRIGGTKSVLEIFAAAGMRSPFDPALMKDLMAHAAQELGVTAPAHV